MTERNEAAALYRNASPLNGGIDKESGTVDRKRVDDITSSVTDDNAMPNETITEISAESRTVQ